MPVQTVCTPLTVVGLSIGRESAEAGQMNPATPPIKTAATAQ